MWRLWLGSGLALLPARCVTPESPGAVHRALSSAMPGPGCHEACGSPSLVRRGLRRAYPQHLGCSPVFPEGGVALIIRPPSSSLGLWPRQLELQGVGHSSLLPKSLGGLGRVVSSFCCVPGALALGDVALSLRGLPTPVT